MSWLIPIALACTLVEIRTNVCHSICRSDGADLGYYLEKTGECVCGYKRKFDELTKTKIILNTNAKPMSGWDN